MIDWTKPIEAVHTDGRTGRVEPHGVISVPGLHYGGIAGVGLIDAFRGGWRKDGSPIQSANPWSIRNVVSTSDEALRRMEALVERMATAQSGGIIYPGTPLEERHEWLHEARAIRALRAPVDPRLAVVRLAITSAPPWSSADVQAAHILAALDAMPK